MLAPVDAHKDTDRRQFPVLLEMLQSIPAKDLDSSRTGSLLHSKQTDLRLDEVALDPIAALETENAISQPRQSADQCCNLGK